MPSKQGQVVLKTLKSNALTIATLAGVLIGIIFGVSLRTREEDWSQREVMYVKFIGSLFLQMLKAIIIPLIIPSLIVAVGSLDLSLSGKLYQIFPKVVKSEKIKKIKKSKKSKKKKIEIEINQKNQK